MNEQIEITLAYAGQLATTAGVSEERIAADVDAPLIDLLRAAGERHGRGFADLVFDEGARLRRALIISLDGSQVASPESLRLRQDHEVFVMTPIAGG